MTKKQAAEKVAKMRRLAEKAGTPQEAETAKRNAEKMISEFGLTEAELSVGAKAAAFDEIMDFLDIFIKTRRDQVPGSIVEVVDQIKKHTKDDDKAAALEKIAAGVKVAYVFFGHNKAVIAIKELIDSTLAKHEVKL